MSAPTSVGCLGCCALSCSDFTSCVIYTACLWVCDSSWCWWVGATLLVQSSITYVLRLSTSTHLVSRCSYELQSSHMYTTWSSDVSQSHSFAIYTLTLTVLLRCFEDNKSYEHVKEFPPAVQNMMTDAAANSHSRQVRRFSCRCLKTVTTDRLRWWKVQPLFTHEASAGRLAQWWW